MSRPLNFGCVALTPAGAPNAALAIAASRSGALGVLNLEFAPDLESALAAIAELERHAHNPFGAQVDASNTSLIDALLELKSDIFNTVLLTNIEGPAFPPIVAKLHARGFQVYAVVLSVTQAQEAESAGVDALIAKGNEAGGWVGEETAFVLLQHLAPRVDLPVFVQGGIGLHSAAACYVAGAAGVVLDSQLLLTHESPISDAQRNRVASMDGSETAAVGASLGAMFRAYSRPDQSCIEELRQLEASETLTNADPAAALVVWKDAIHSRVDWHDEAMLWAIGQDAALASSLGSRFKTVGGVLQALDDAVREHVRVAAAQPPMARNAPLAQSHGTLYPIVQGPMTRVSDRPAFTNNVAKAGGLPFLALALMRGEEVRSLLQETQALLQDRPWGVGILGFVPQILRTEQLEAIRAVKPPFALIAGGRPDQARVLEEEGITTYLHVPSPGLLKMFLEDGARRFVFEGRECGGHVGPRTSFVLWEEMIDVLTHELKGPGPHSDFHVLFAGGIHDGLSAAMVSAMAAPLVELGVRVGVLIGTAYLFTQEAVESSAIQASFQAAALECEETVLLEATAGYATRCLPSPFVETFKDEKRQMIRSGVPVEEQKERLEILNIGRLRIASKGEDHNPLHGKVPDEPRLLSVAPEEQWEKGMYMIGQVAALRGEVCTLAQLHAAVSDDSTNILLTSELFPEREGDKTPEPAEIAIVGMASILPGAPNLDAYWKNILNKFDAITEVPKERWDWRQYFDTDRSARDKVYSRWGGFIDEVPFDPVEFGMPPSTLASIEPFQLLALAVVRDALKDAGYADRPFARDRASVILGAGGGGADMTAGYMVRSSLPEIFGADAAASIVDRLPGVLPEWTEDSFSGLLMNVAAGRIANRFDLGGVNYTVDAACASSLAAVYLAVRDLDAGTSDVVIVGGVDAIQDPFGFLCFAKTQALSPSGRCKPFDESADGIAISEGFAAVVLKRLADAERDGDKVYAVIRGVGGSSDGRDKSLTAPRPAGQIRALRRAYAQAGYSPASVELIEAHGTGTVAGDQAEVEALSSFFKEADATKQTSAIGSVKSMIGHTKATAGVAGLVKVAKALHHRVLPPTIGVTKPNPNANFPESPFYVNTEARPWVKAEGGLPRRAGVSAFGFGGTNFHIALEEYQGSFLAGAQGTNSSWPAELFVLRGNSRSDVQGAVRNLLASLEQGAKPALPDLAYTLMVRAEAFTAGPTLALVAESIEQLTKRLREAEVVLESGAIRSHATTGIDYSEDAAATNGKLAFLFPGQGSHYVNMQRELALMFPEVRAAFDLADAHLTARLGKPLSKYVFPPPAFGADEEKAQLEALTETNVAQPALGTTEVGLLDLLGSLGIRPEMTAGHSFGEFVALHAGGAISKADMLALSEARGRFMKEGIGTDSGAMAAVMAPFEALATLPSELQITLANLNAPKQTVIAGPSGDVAKAITWCTEQGLTAKQLPVACAFHTTLVAPAQKRLAAMLEGVDVSTPGIPVFSNTTAAAYPADQVTIRAQLSEHLARPVRFVNEIEAMYESGARIFLEVGPRQVLTGLVGQILGEREHVRVALDQPGRPGLVQFLNAMATLVSEGVSLNQRRLFKGRSVRFLDLTKLSQETGVPKYSATTWMVGGGGIRPANGRRERAELPLAIEVAGAAVAKNEPVTQQVAAANGAAEAKQNGSAPSQSEKSPAPAASNGQNPDTSRSRPVEERLNAPPPTPATATPVPLGGEVPRSSVPAAMSPVPMAMGMVAPVTSDVIGHFQQVMRRFLDVQESVMLAMLGQQQAQSIAPRSTLQPRVAPAALPAPVQAPAPQPVNLQQYDLQPLPMPPAEVHTNGNGVTHSNGRNGHAPEAPAYSNGHNSNGAVTHDATPVVPVPAASVVVEQVQAQVAAPSIGRDEIQAQLLVVVSERTGYPAEALNLDADLEADLGVDSIKRVEIAGTMLRWLSDYTTAAPEVEALTAARTLRQVIDQLTEVLETETPVAPAKETQPVPLAGEARSTGLPPIQRFVLRPVAASHVESAAKLDAAGVVVIVDDEAGVGEKLAASLQQRGYRTARISSAAEQIEKLTLDELRGPAGRANALVYLAQLNAAAALSVDQPQQLVEQITAGSKLLFHLTKLLLPDLQQSAGEGAAVLGATAMGGAFGCDQNRVAPGQGWVSGFLKSVAQEAPAVRCKAVDLFATDPAVMADQLLAELLAADGLVETGYDRNGARVRLEPMKSELKAGGAELSLTSDSVVLVTGGARGITAETCFALADAAQPTLVLVGRTALPSEPEPSSTAGLTNERELKRVLFEEMARETDTPRPIEIERRFVQLLREREVRETLDRITKAGAKVAYEVCDVQDTNAFGQLIDSVYERYGRIDGVFHGAGVIEDKLLADKSWDSFQRVLSTKVNGAVSLAAKLRPESLRFLVFFSSVSGRFGNRGQADYAAANEVLNKLAQDLAGRWPSQVVAINWGPWQTTGMVSPEVMRQFAERGVALIPIETGSRMLIEELRNGNAGEAEVLIGGSTRLEAATLVEEPVTVRSPVAAVSVSQPNSAVATPALPLLHAYAQLERTAAGQFEVVRTLSLEQDLYLKDHVLDGKPVLPFAMALELMAEVAAAGWPDWEVGQVQDVRALRGIVLRNEEEALRVIARQVSMSEANGHGPRLMLDLSIVSAAAPHVVHYRSAVEMVKGLDGAVPLLPAPLDTPAKGGILPVSLEEAYRDWLFHGRLFQAMNEIHEIGPGGILATLERSLPSECLRHSAGEWLIDPILFDAALQMHLLWSRMHWGLTLLPTSALAYQRLASGGGSASSESRLLRCDVRIKPETREPICQTDVFFYAPNGNLMGLLKGMEGTGSRALNRLGQNTPGLAQGQILAAPVDGPS